MRTPHGEPKKHLKCHGSRLHWASPFLPPTPEKLYTIRITSFVPAMGVCGQSCKRWVSCLLGLIPCRLPACIFAPWATSFANLCTGTFLMAHQDFPLYTHVSGASFPHYQQKGGKKDTWLKKSSFFTWPLDGAIAFYFSMLGRYNNPPLWPTSLINHFFDQ